MQQVTEPLTSFDSAAIAELAQALQTGEGSGVRMQRGPLPGSTGGYRAKGIDAGISAIARYVDNSGPVPSYNVLFSVTSSYDRKFKDGVTRTVTTRGSTMMEYRRG